MRLFLGDPTIYMEIKMASSQPLDICMHACFEVEPKKNLMKRKPSFSFSFFFRATKGERNPTEITLRTEKRANIMYTLYNITNDLSSMRVTQHIYIAAWRQIKLT